MQCNIYSLHVHWSVFSINVNVCIDFHYQAFQQNHSHIPYFRWARAFFHSTQLFRGINPNKNIPYWPRIPFPIELNAAILVSVCKREFRSRFHSFAPFRKYTLFLLFVNRFHKSIRSNRYTSSSYCIDLFLSIFDIFFFAWFCFRFFVYNWIEWTWLLRYAGFYNFLSIFDGPIERWDIYRKMWREKKNSEWFHFRNCCYSITKNKTYSVFLHPEWIWFVISFSFGCCFC